MKTFEISLPDEVFEQLVSRANTSETSIHDYAKILLVNAISAQDPREFARVLPSSPPLHPPSSSLSPAMYVHSTNEVQVDEVDKTTKSIHSLLYNMHFLTTSGNQSIAENICYRVKADKQVEYLKKLAGRLGEYRVSVADEMSHAANWTFANPKKAKKNLEMFLISWLKRAVDNAKKNGHNSNGGFYRPWMGDK